MQLTLVALISLLPLLTVASPVVGKPRAIRIPLSKRNNLSENGVVKTEALQAQMSKAKMKIGRGFSNFKANTGAAHPMDNGTLSKRATGSDSLADDNGQLWQGGISVGTPATDFTVDFDTGSSDLFLPGTGCDSTCSGHTVYDTSASSTAQDFGQTFNLAYGDGSTVSGEQYTDTVTIAGLTATNQRVGAATQYSTGFSSSQFPPDGLMGMAFPQISSYGADPVFQTLISQGQTDEAVFGFNLATQGSELFLGGVNTDKFSGNLNYVPVTEVGFWQVSMDSVNVDGSSALSSVSAIIDTGTTLVIGDTSSVSQVYAQIPGSADASQTVGAGFWTVPCNSIPSISLTFGGQDYTISPETFNLGQASSGSSDCVGGLAAQDGEDFWIVGDVFLQNVYAAFDVGNTQVGFANLA